MLKLRNAVLTALLAFCLAMPFVSCSFNDVATVDVSDKVKVQSGNNQNGGNENPSGGDSGTDEPGTDEPGTDEPGTEYPGTDEQGTEYPGTDEPGTDYPGTDYPGTDYPGTDYPGTEYPGTDYPGTDEPEYTVEYQGHEVSRIYESELSYFETVLTADTDYTIDGTVITLTESGYEKVKAYMSGAGE